MIVALSNVTTAVAELQQLQRRRAITLKSRNMQANRLQAVVAGTIGYSSRLTEKDRQKKFKEASALINQVIDGDAHSPLESVIRVHMHGIDEFNESLAGLEKEMRAFAKRLPVAAWAELPAQLGFGLLSLATVIGETGDLANYANPAKVWKRLGCAPYMFDGKTQMGATWRSGKQGKLPAEEWETFGYSPRRRSIAYIIGENLIKQNGDGPYRARWLEAKVRVVGTHPEWNWSKCEKCSRGKCSTCGGTRVKCKRAHLHGMLLATKLLLKNLWIEWPR